MRTIRSVPYYCTVKKFFLVSKIHTYNTYIYLYPCDTVPEKRFHHELMGGSRLPTYVCVQYILYDYSDESGKKSNQNVVSYYFIVSVV